MYDFLAGRLRQLGIRQQDLVESMGLNQGSISHRFCGRTQWSIEEMYKLLDICRADPSELHIYFPRPEPRRRRRAS